MKNLFIAIFCVALLCSPSFAQNPCGKGGLTVSVTPPVAKVGETITVTLGNPTNSTVYLSSSCVYQVVYHKDCGGQPAFTPICLTVITPIPPGTSRSQTWDQKDDYGKQVPPGVYGFYIHVNGPAGPDGCCPKVTISDCVLPVNYGSGGAGSGGFVPRMGSAGGLSQVGNGSFQILVTNGLGGAPALMFVSSLPASIPAPWGTLLVDPLPPLLQFPLQLGGSPGQPGQGAITIPAPVPNLPVLVGTTVYLQTLIGDPGSTGGISHTDGLTIKVCA